MTHEQAMEQACAELAVYVRDRQPKHVIYDAANRAMDHGARRYECTKPDCTYEHGERRQGERRRGTP